MAEDTNWESEIALSDSTKIVDFKIIDSIDELDAGYELVRIMG
jgi:hypothetical protein